LRRSSALNPEASQLCEIVDEESGRIEWLVANLLEFARPLAPVLEPRSLISLIEEALSHTLRTEESAALKVTRTLDGSLPPVPVDPRLMQLALTNVFRNAVQAMRGRGELEVRLDREKGEGCDWARIAIVDTGPGIRAEHKDRAFEPFFTTRSTGHGLGLTLVKRVVNDHGGTVDLTSHAGRGTTCVIRLKHSREGS